MNLKKEHVSCKAILIHIQIICNIFNKLLFGTPKPCYDKIKPSFLTEESESEFRFFCMVQHMGGLGEF